MNKILILVLFLILIVVMALAQISPILGSGESKKEKKLKKPIKKIVYDNIREYPTIEKLLKTLNAHVTSFEIISQEQWNKMRDAIDSSWSDEQIRSVLRLIITQKIQSSQGKINKIPKSVIAKINADNILKTARKYNVSPLNLIRRVLKLSYKSSQITNWIEFPNEIGDADISRLIKIGVAHDAENPQNYKKILQESFEYEDAVGVILHENNIAFKSQDDLVKEQTKLHGRAILTPDFLLAAPIECELKHPNGTTSRHEINWIDVKNYMLIETDFIIKKLAEQAEKYVKAYGPGAFMFRYGFLNTIKFKDCVMLSGEIQKN